MTRLLYEQATEEVLTDWQRQLKREQELDHHGFAGDDDVVAIIGDMEDEYTEADHRALMQAAHEGSRTALVKMVEATRGFKTTSKALSETKFGVLATPPLDRDDLSLEVEDE